MSGGGPLGNVLLLTPDGSTQASVSSAILASFMEPQLLATTATYSIEFDPLQAGTGTLTLDLYDVPPDINDTIAIGGPARAVALDPGQRAFLTFSGAAGQQVTVRLTGNTFSTATVKLLKPDGSQLPYSTSIAANFNLATQTLPTSGTYTVVVDPQGANTGGINVSVTSP